MITWINESKTLTKIISCKCKCRFDGKEVIQINDEIMINVNVSDSGNIKIDEKSYKNILIYYIAYVMIKNLKYIKVNSVNSLYLILNKMNGYFEEINGNEYLMLVPTNESKEK